MRRITYTRTWVVELTDEEWELEGEQGVIERIGQGEVESDNSEVTNVEVFYYGLSTS